MRDDTMEALTGRAVSRARRWQETACRKKTAVERTFLRRLERLLSHPEGKAVMVALIDQSFRSKNPGRVADQIHQLFSTHGIPDFFSAGDRLLIRLFLVVGRYFPRLSVPGIIGRIRRDSRRSVLSGEQPAFDRYLARRKTEGVHLNINHKSEAKRS